MELVQACLVFLGLRVLMILSGFLVGNFDVVTDCALWAEIDHMYQDH